MDGGRNELDLSHLANGREIRIDNLKYWGICVNDDLISIFENIYVYVVTHVLFKEPSFKPTRNKGV